MHAASIKKKMLQFFPFLEQHGYALICLVVLLEQLGLPIPAAPLLLTAGALSAGGRFSLFVIIALAAAASLAADSIWYALGRRQGQPILQLLCRISLEPDSCVSYTKTWFRRLGAAALLIAKFFPGLSTAAPPLAGSTGMPLWKFLLSDLAGSALWAAAFAALGFVFHRQLQAVAQIALRFGSGVGIILFSAFAVYLSLKLWQRHRFIRKLRTARIQPEELLEQLRSEEKPAIIDLRHTLELGDEPMRIPGAVWFERKEMEQRHREIPRDRDIILYCS